MLLKHLSQINSHQFKSTTAWKLMRVRKCANAAPETNTKDHKISSSSTMNEVPQIDEETMIKYTMQENMQRKFIEPTIEGFRHKFKIKEEMCMKVLTYNILANCYALDKIFAHCPRELLDWDIRCPKIKREIDHYNPDVFSLQEVERHVYEEDFEPYFLDKGFEGIYFCKPPEIEEGSEEGIALFYRKTMFTRVSSVCAPFNEYFERIGTGQFYRHVRTRRDGFAMAVLKHNHSGRHLLVSGVHLYWNPKWPDAKVAQAHVLCETIATVLERQYLDMYTPVILLGDFNATWKKWQVDRHDKWIDGRYILSGVYKLLTEGMLDITHNHHPFIRNHVGKIKGANLRDMRFTSSNLLFESAYFRAHGQEPLITSYSKTFASALDYIFYTSNDFDVIETLDMPYEAHGLTNPYHVKFRAMPNSIFPSDHLPISAKIALKEPFT